MSRKVANSQEMTLKADEWVFSCWRNVDSDSADVTSAIKLFHICRLTTRKARLNWESLVSVSWPNERIWQASDAIQWTKVFVVRARLWIPERRSWTGLALAWGLWLTMACFVDWHDLVNLLCVILAKNVMYSDLYCMWKGTAYCVIIVVDSEQWERTALSSGSFWAAGWSRAPHGANAKSATHS